MSPRRSLTMNVLPSRMLIVIPGHLVLLRLFGETVLLVGPVVTGGLES
jgi:hypothetical protein